MTVEVIALIIAAAALVIAYLVLRGLSSVEKRLSEVSGSVASLRSALDEARTHTDEKLANLQLQVRAQAGQPTFWPTMTIKEALAVHPRVGEVLSSFHLGACSECAVSDVDTIAGACQSYGINEQALMDALRQLVEEGGGSTKPIDVARKRLSI